MTSARSDAGQWARRAGFVAGFVAGLIAALVTLLAAVWLLHRYPFLHMESATYLANALDGRPLLEQIFDVQRNDFGLYQARELSYAFDLVEARAVAATFRLTGAFVPVSLLQVALVALVVGSTVAWGWADRARIGLALWIPALLFLTSASTLLGTRHFRSAKSLAAIALVLLAWRLARPAAGMLAQCSVFLCAAALVLADRQGTFFVCAFALLAWREDGASPRLLALVAAVALGVVYDLAIGPLLVRTFAYQEVNWSLQSGAVTPDSLWSLSVWRGAGRWFFDSIALLAGSWGVFWGVIVAGASVWAAGATGGRRRLIQGLGALAALLVLALLMKSRHPPLDGIAVRTAYYNTPMLALFTVGVALWLGRLSGHPAWRRWRRPIVWCGIVMGLGNLLALPRRADALLHGADADAARMAPLVTRCIEVGADAARFETWPRDVAWVGRYRRLCERFRAVR